MAQQRTTANDPDFLATYGSTSRLAFLGGKKRRHLAVSV